MEFVSYSSIPRLSSTVRITEKIHGTNAQIYIEGDHMLCGSKNRWLSPEDDNAGFCNFCFSQRDEIIDCLGDGRHFGEWYGAGINSGYGLKEKRLALFVPKDDLLPWMDRIPVLYKDLYKEGVISETMEALKQNGSSLVPGWMKPEGVVIEFWGMGSKSKCVFDIEEVAWGGIKKIRVKQEIDEEAVAKYLQPIRLQKLMGRDEKYIREYPRSLPNICKDYVADLVKETDFDGEDDFLKKNVKSAIFKFIKLMVEN